MNIRRALLGGAACFILLLAHAAPSWAQVLAGYRDDYQGLTPATGWSYEWNGSGPIGTAANYVNLMFEPVGNRYTSTGSPTPNPNPGGFVQLTATGGHPGVGSSQGGPGGIDRFAIAGYTIQPGEEGRIAISNSLLTRANTLTGSGRTGVDLHVYVNDTLVRNLAYPINPTPHAFNTVLGNLNAGDTIRVAVGPQGNDSNDGVAMDFAVQVINSFNDVAVANYRNDYQDNGFPDGWRYQWNSGGAIGDPANYTDLEPTGSQYNLDGVTGLPRANPAAFLNLNANGGHPGMGSAQSGSGNLDRYAIAAFMIAEDGQYAITDSFLNRPSTSGNGGDIFIHVNDDDPALHMYFPAGASNVNFDTFLGDLLAGDMVYVAIGPNLDHGNDTFQFDFTITLLQAAPVPEPGALAMWGLLGGALLAFAWVRRRRGR